jgi:hypothetical protein
VEALASTRVGQDEMGALLDEARAIFQPTCYDCLGCPVCPPAIAANALSEAFPEASAGLPLCPTDDPAERTRIVSTDNKAYLEYGGRSTARSRAHPLSVRAVLGRVRKLPLHLWHTLGHPLYRRIGHGHGRSHLC